MVTSSNGRTERKSLAGQLDRLDMILDGLADGLNEAVASAVKDAVVVAVDAAVRELLASAELQRRLHPQPTAKPGFFRRAASVVCRGAVTVAKGCWSGAASLVCRCRVKTVQAVKALRVGRVVMVDRVRRGMTALGRKVWLGCLVATGFVRRFRNPLLLAVAAGATLAVACHFAGPTVSSVVNGVAGFVGALVGGMLGRLRRVLQRADLEWWDVNGVP
jgi:hypothetical protein